MFICSQCNKSSRPNEKATKLSIKTRQKTYRDGTVGSEIVKEVDIYQGCVSKNKKGG